jgi:hypothetical protein
VAHVGFAFLDQLLGEVVQALEVVGGVGDLGRGEAQPADGLLDGDKVLLLLCVRVGVVKPEDLEVYSGQ